MLLGVVGLGYVGLPLLNLLSSKYSVVGVDVCDEKIAKLNNQESYVLDVKTPPPGLYTTDFKHLEKCSVVFVCVPTPAYPDGSPDLTFLESSSRAIGKHVKRNMVICYESTVYPTTTQKCVAWLEEESGLKNGVDFHVAYSPERINPGDHINTVDKIVKLVGGTTELATYRVKEIYDNVLANPTHKCSSAEVAELAKLFENVQRAVNITLVNELSLLCGALGIKTKDVLDACGTKWNFMKVTPGMPAGHCLPINMRYLKYIADEKNVSSGIVTAAIQAATGFVMQLFQAIQSKLEPGSHVALMGVAYKADVPDVRNSATTILYALLKQCSYDVTVADCTLNSCEDVPLSELVAGTYDAVVIMTDHTIYKLQGIRYVASLLKPQGWIFDTKYMVKEEDCVIHNVNHWSP